MKAHGTSHRSWRQWLAAPFFLLTVIALTWGISNSSAVATTLAAGSLLVLLIIEGFARRWIRKDPLS